MRRTFPPVVGAALTRAGRLGAEVEKTPFTAAEGAEKPLASKATAVKRTASSAGRKTSAVQRPWAETAAVEASRPLTRTWTVAPETAVPETVMVATCVPKPSAGLEMRGAGGGW